MREILAASQRVFLASREVIGKYLRKSWVWTDRCWSWVDRSWPWLGRHRVIAISTINSVLIVALVCLVAGVSMKSPGAEAMTHGPRSDESAAEVRARTAAPARSDPRPPASRGPHPRASSSAKIGQREYEVEERRKVRASQGYPGAMPPQTAQQPAEDAVIERSDAIASDDPSQQHE